MRRAVLIAVSVALLAAAATAEEPATQLTGRVVDENDKPLAGAKVAAYGHLESEPESGTRELASTTTDKDGAFRIAVMETRPLSFIVATKEGKSFDWSPCGRDDTEFSLQIGPAASIEGTVVDESGKPIIGAAVDMQAFPPDLSSLKRLQFPAGVELFVAKTNSQGHFRFNNVPMSAQVEFSFSASGFADASAFGDFAPGQKGLRFVLPPEGRIEGTVVEKATGKGLADVTVCATRSGINTQWADATTDENGRFALTGLIRGKFDVEVVGKGRALPEWIGSQDGIEVDNGKTAAARIDTVKGGTLEVVLTDASTGKAIETNALVTVSPTSDLSIRKYSSAVDGAAAGFRLAAGTYVMPWMMAPGYTYEPSTRRKIPVETGKTQRVTVPLTSNPPVQLSVQDSAGRNVPGAKARIYRLVTEPRDIVADKNGKLAIGPEDILSGFCFILVRHPEQDLATLVVVANGEQPPRISLSRPKRIVGVVTDPTGRPIAGAQVQAQIDASHLGRWAVIATVNTDKDGQYAMDLPRGGLTFAISARAAGFSTSEILLKEGPVARGPRSTDLVLRPTDRTVRGVVTDTRGSPVAGAIVKAKISRGPAFPGSVVTDAEGRFVLDHLSDVPEIRVSARVPGRAWAGSKTIGPEDQELTIRVESRSWD